MEQLLRIEQVELEREDVSDGGVLKALIEGKRSAYTWWARQPWLWKKCAIEREEVVNIGNSGA
jgi:hypothetical protein